jgi:glycosyltransferase involved in cell wall biosynthesis
VLFVGAAGLRKGLPYLAEAATVLKKRNPAIQIVIAGPASNLVRDRPETRDLAFLGMLDRQRMADEFASADLFCLPSLAEGSATSVFEALANGLPVVTTASSGSIVQHEAEGLIVPERDAPALAGAIETIVANRGLREAFSTAARRTAASYDHVKCGQTFVQTILAVAGPRQIV